MLTALLSRCIILAFGTMYPAYKSYKAIRSKSMHEYLTCLRYWIVYASFVVVENVCDILFSWIPFYNGLKIVLAVFLLMPSGSAMIYKSFIQPFLRKHESGIDMFLKQLRQEWCSMVMKLGSLFLKHGSDVFINTAIKGSAYLDKRMTKSLSLHNIHQVDVKCPMVAQSGDQPTHHHHEVMRVEDDFRCGDDSAMTVRRQVNDEQRRDGAEWSDENNDDMDWEVYYDGLRDHQARPRLSRGSKPSSSSSYGGAAASATGYRTADSAHIGTITRSRYRQQQEQQER